MPGLEQWGAEDLRLLAGLFVNLMVAAAYEMVSPAAEDAGVRREIEQTLRHQARMIVVGAAGWQPLERYRDGSAAREQDLEAALGHHVAVDAAAHGVAHRQRALECVRVSAAPRGVQPGDPDPHVVALAGEAERHLARVERDHVRQQVVEQLLHRARGDPVVGAVVDEDPDGRLVGHALPPALPDLGGQRLQVDLGPGHQRSLARVGQQRVDDPVEPLHLGRRVQHRAAYVVGQAGPLGELLELEADARDRRTQHVGGVLEEVPVAADRVLELGGAEHQRVVDRDDLGDPGLRQVEVEAPPAEGGRGGGQLLERPGQQGRGDQPEDAGDQAERDHQHDQRAEAAAERVTDDVRRTDAG